MKRIVFGLLLLAMAAAGPAYARGPGWRVVVDGEESRMIMSEASVKPTVDGYEVKVRVFLAQPGSVREAPGKTWVMAEARSEFDCKAGRTRTLASTLYAPDRTVVVDDREANAWFTLDADSRGATLMRAVCDKHVADGLPFVAEAPPETQRQDYLTKIGAAV